VSHRLAKSQAGLARHESELLKRIACGSEVDPQRIKPRLVEVQANSKDELLFRYTSLHWSIPVSSGYGRRLRFLVLDESNDKLIGIIGLGDPVFSLGERDRWVGWDREARRQRLRNVMDAFVLGAVPPYSRLLCGKLVAMLVASNEVRGAFRRKYGSQESLISERPLDNRLALITTSSALGRSSIYNRLSYRGSHLFIRAGFTQGSGEFHFVNGLYDSISKYATRYCQPTAKQERWGTGFRNRREVIRKCLSKIGLSQDWIYHGIRREIFVVPLARNTKDFLRGDHLRLQWFDYSMDQLFAWFKQRWLLPRASRVDEYKAFDSSDYALWLNGTKK
jgi:hypothetical protein